MSSEWILKELEEIATDVTVGFVGSMATEYIAHGIPFLRSLNVEPFGIKTKDLKFISEKFHKKISKSTLRAGDVVIVRTGKPGACAVVPEWLDNSNCSDLVIVRCGKSIRPRFLCYWINSIASHHISSHLVGAVQQHFNVGSAKNMKVAVPSLMEQDQVVAVLGGIDDRINSLRETNTTLEAIAQALFKSWFVDFDPVYAKSEGREPEGIDAETAALFPDSFEELELGLMPKGWRVGCVGDFACQKKGSVNPLISPDITFEHYSLPAFDNEQTPVYEKGIAIKSNKTPLPQEVVLLSKLNPHIPRIWLPVKHGENAVCSTEFLAFSPIGASSKEFIYTFFCSPYFSQRLCQMVTGTSNSHQRVKPDQVSAFNAIIPDTVYIAFTEVAKILFEKVFVNRHQIITLTALRDTLLPRLISGQLKVSKNTLIAEVVK